MGEAGIVGGAEAGDLRILLPAYARELSLQLVHMSRVYCWAVAGSRTVEASGRGVGTKRS